MRFVFACSRSFATSLLGCPAKHDEPTPEPEPELDAGMPDAAAPEPDASLPDEPEPAPEGSFVLSWRHDKLPILQGTSEELVVTSSARTASTSRSSSR